jgi:hypothetical protein
LLLRRPSGATLIPLLVGLVLGLDLVWDLLVGSTGTVGYGFVDEPAHLATCAIALLTLATVLGRLPSARFAVAALAAGVAIDLDHLPRYLGSDWLSAGTPRPYLHCGLAVLVVLAASVIARGGWRSVLLGIAFGFAAHLLRDVATGPGVPLGLPLSTAAVRAPYSAYAACLGSVGVLAASWALLHRFTPSIRLPLRATGAWSLVAALVALGLVLGPGNVALGAAQRAYPRKHVHRHKHRRVPSRVAVGVYVPGADSEPSKLDEYESAVGRPPAIVQVYRYWSSLPFEAKSLDSIVALGAMPLVTWEPWEGEGSAVSLWEIAAGGRDAYIAEAARQAAAWGGPLFVRFAHEMNGGWYPWGVNGNTPAVFKAAWKHVVEIFRREGAANVRWVWTPYIDGGHFPFKRYYPGDGWVDWVGLDGFNWGAHFMSFAQLFDDSYKTMVKMTPKPLMIAEVGSIEAGGSKPEWIRRALSRALPRLPHIRALVWWSDSHPDGANLRIDSSTTALSALATGLQAPRFKWGPSLLLATPSWRRGR